MLTHIQPHNAELLFAHKVDFEGRWDAFERKAAESHRRAVRARAEEREILVLLSSLLSHGLGRAVCEADSTAALGEVIL